MKRPPGPPPSKRLFGPNRSSSIHNDLQKKPQPREPPPSLVLRDISLLRQSADCPPQFRPETEKNASHGEIHVHEEKIKEKEKLCFDKSEPRNDFYPQSIQKENDASNLKKKFSKVEKNDWDSNQFFTTGRRPPPGPPPSRTETRSLNKEGEKQESFLENETKTENACKQANDEDHLPHIDIIPLQKKISQGSEKISKENVLHSSLLKKAPTTISFAEINDSANEFSIKTRQQKDLRSGSLSIRCIKACNIRRKDQIDSRSSLNAFLLFSLGLEKCENQATSKFCIQGKTNVQCNDGYDVSFKEEIVELDVIEPSKISESDASIHLKVQLFDHNNWGKNLLAEGKVSANRFFSSNGKKWNELIPLMQPGDQTSNSNVHLEFQFQETKRGMVVFTLYECNKLVLGNAAVSNPYAILSIGEKIRQRSRTINNGGSNPYFGEEKILLWVDETNWFDQIMIQVWNEGSDKHELVGVKKISLLSYMNQSLESCVEETVSLLHSDTMQIKNMISPSPAKMRFKIEFLQAGELSAQVIRGKFLREIGNPHQMDPFVLLRVEGRCSSIEKKTVAVKDGGTNPTWQQSLTFPIVDQYTLIIECYDHDALSDATTLIGSSQLSLLSVFKNGHFDTYVQLKYTNEFGVEVDSGQIEISFTFNGPRGVAYPQYQPTVTSYDDTHRNSKLAVGEQNEKNDQDYAQDLLRKSQNQKGDKYDCGFTNDQIAHAFKFLDLDKNGYLGAQEIRHILICMGELVTDEEIDMMIAMLDTNGDGQVSLDEFRSMVQDPDPSRDLSGNTKTTRLNIDMDTNERKKEIERRNKKREIVFQYVSKYKLTLDQILLMWKMFKQLPVHEKSNNCIDLDFFCKALPVENTGETKNFFKLFDEVGSGKVNVKEVVLSLSNFISSSSIKERCESIFNMFDEERSGFLSLKQLEEIMVGNHMMSRRMILKKAQTVMRYADTNNSGGVCLQELIVAASKFPTLLFPNHTKYLRKTTSTMEGNQLNASS